MVYFCYTSNLFLLDASPTAQIVFFIVAVAVNTFIYGKIIRRLSKHNVTKTKDGGGHPGANKIRNTVARMLIENGIIFFICIAPFQLANLFLIVQSHTYVSVLDESQSQALRWFATRLLLLNSSINPYVYGVANRNYRQALMKAFSCKQIDNMITATSSVSGQNIKDYIKDSSV